MEATGHSRWFERFHAFLRLALRRGRQIARVALARKLAVHLYWMLRRGWNYEQMMGFGWHAE
jgi:hypothetical protein